MNKYLFALIMATFFTPAYADSPRVYSKNSVVFNRTFADWSAAWRQWADSLPANKHPLFDTAPCSEGNSGPVWFLGGRFCAMDVNQNCENVPTVRTCEVPQGVALYFPVLNSGCLDGEAAAGQCSPGPGVKSAGPSISEIRKAVADGIDQATGLQVTVDGKPIKGDIKKNFRVQSTVYTSLVPAGSLYPAVGEPNIVEGTYTGVDDGIYVMLKPLKKGSHTLNFKGTLPQWDFNLDFTYNIIVQ
jgi:hypothetical protein